MRKLQLLLFALLILFVPLSGFKHLSEATPKQTICLPLFKNKTVTASNSQVLRIGFVLDPTTLAIQQIRVFADSDCTEYSYCSYTGSVYLSGGNYYANNVNIDLDCGTTNVIVDGLLTNGLTGCEGS